MGPLLSAINMSAPQQLPTESTNCTNVMLKLMPIQRHTTVMAVVMVMAVHTVMPDTEDTDTVADTTDKRLVNLFSTNIVFLKNYRLQRVLDLIKTMMTKVKWVAPSHSLPTNVFLKQKIYQNDMSQNRTDFYKIICYQFVV